MWVGALVMWLRYIYEGWWNLILAANFDVLCQSQGSNGSAKSCITDVEELVARKACVTGAKERVADSLAWRFVPAILACSSIVSRLWRLEMAFCALQQWYKIKKHIQSSLRCLQLTWHLFVLLPFRRCTKHIDVAILTVLVLRKTVMNKMTTTNGNEEDSWIISCFCCFLVCY
jgi:hypothetical protein